ncbi:aryl-sulfate sulfotransferase [Limosilactobacillus mucosae]|uniref:aryl-sulfate sulfotransferase n=1 Tax=Limosilactobacillus mucosae TaxID=97478 RepID=UPI00233ECCB8|nr:aryl-sulfate sulfotransferase [Limosilactobacillus mucosae]MDC2839193.1 aryl-sulfate sulfotransferase [Limosilactobacillus mucosae]MDC2841931.1 aryl-sulfate sulfotransferase [Limosilactobacillus mucosae]MDC2844955.1 aryl-sulfate sulfotransferase [Limosilactobacillus mucosae]
MHHKKGRWLALIAVLLVLCGVGGWFGYRHYSLGVISDKQIIKNINSHLLKNNPTSKQTKNYAKIVKSTTRTLDNAYVKVNPYGTSPLTALMIFKTDQAAKVTYTVVGKTDNTSITNTVKGYKTTHQVPIVGLYANYSNQVQVTLTYKDGTTEQKTFTIKTGKLPKNLRQTKITVSKSNKSKMQIGNNELTYINKTSEEPFAVDADGNIRWYSTLYSRHTFVQLSNGHLLIQNRTNGNKGSYNVLSETDYLGRIYRRYRFSDKLGKSSLEQYITAVHHDALELPNHNLLVTISGGDKYAEDVIAEIDYKTGKTVKVIDFKKLLPSSMYRNYSSTTTKGGKIDWLHMNSLYYDQKTGNLLVSARNQDITMSINYKSGKINWIYSGKKKSSWPKKYRSKLLTPAKGTTITGGQHDLTLLSSKNGKLKVLLYDNNIDVTNGNAKTSGKYSQAVQYTIDTKKKTIKQTWSYGKSLGKDNFTRVIGSAQRLSNGNTLIDFGYKHDGSQSNIIEVDKNNNQVFNLTISSSKTDRTYVYRAYRVKFTPSNFVFDATK